MIQFLYNGKRYQIHSDLSKKLKKMGITENDIEILNDEKTIELEEYNNLHHYLNKNNNHIITSIYNTLDELVKQTNLCSTIIIKEEWEQID